MDQLLQKPHLSQWRHLVKQPLTSTHKEMAKEWNSCAIGERIRREGRHFTNEKELAPEAKVLGQDFYFAVCRKKNYRALEIIERIENLSTIWQNKKQGFFSRILS